MDRHDNVACLGDFLACEHSPDVQESMHNNSLGAATAAAEAAAAARRTSLEAALAEQHAAQLRGLDIPMLDDLLPLEDLHDPFLEDWASSHALLLHSTSQQQQQQQADCQPRVARPHMSSGAPRADPSDPGSGAPFSPAAAGLYGIPAYAEPECPAAAMLNNAVPGQVPALVLGPMSMVHPASAAAAMARASVGSQRPGLPLAPGPVAQVQLVAGAGLPPGLPPAIAAAQQRAAAAAVQMQLVAQQHGQPIVQLKPVLVQLPVQPAPQAQQPSSSDGVAGGSRCSNASNASTRQTAAMPRNSSESSGNQQGTTDATDDAGGPTAGAAAAAAAAAAVPGAILLPISAVATGSAPSLSAATGMTFTAGTTTAAHAAASGGRAPAKRGGRPREKKSYDALIDPGLPIEEVRRLRRMLSNRESARRSRRRRQTQLSGLEEELEQLKSDKERLQSELHHTTSFAQQLSAEKQQLLAEVERLRCQLAAASTSSPTAAAAQQQQAQAGSMSAELPPGSSGLPPLIEKAQRLARQLNRPRVKAEGGAGAP